MHHWITTAVLSSTLLLHASAHCLDDIMRLAMFANDNNTSSFEPLVKVANPQYNQVLPSFVLLPESITHVQEIVQCAYANDLSIVVKGGGHSFGGYSSVFASNDSLNSTLLVNFALMKSVSWSVDNSSVTVQAGARWRDVYEAFRTHGGVWIVTGGLCPSVGVVSFSLGGGVGPVSRKYGLALDNIKSLTMVTTNGESVVTANSEQNAELFWAMRGSGGGNFGIVVDLTFKVHSGPIYFTWGTVCFEPSLSQEEVAEIFQALGTASRMYSRDLNIDPILTSEGLCFWIVYQGTKENLTSELSSLTMFNFEQRNTKTEFHEFNCFWEMIVDYAHHHGYEEFSSDSGLIKSCLINDISDSLSHFLAETYTNKLLPESCSIHMIEFGGKVNDIPRDATAFYWRDAQYMLYASCGYDYKNATDFIVTRNTLRNWYSKVQGWCQGAYVNFIDADLPNWAYEYYGEHLPHLSQVQRFWNPQETSPFWLPRSIPDDISLSESS